MELGGSKIFQIRHERKVPCLDIWNFVKTNDEEFIKDLFKTNTKINKEKAVAYTKVTWLVKVAYVHT